MQLIPTDMTIVILCYPSDSNVGAVVGLSDTSVESRAIGSICNGVSVLFVREILLTYLSMKSIRI